MNTTIITINTLLWDVLLVIIIALFWVKTQNTRAWLYIVCGVFGSVSLALQLISIHRTYDVFICGAFVVMNTYFWIKTREKMELEKAAKEKHEVQ